MGELRVSVAMATYNGALYLREQLDSSAAQTRQPDELVVTDDGSTDATLAILEAFQASASFEVRVYRSSNRLGVSRNFEKALRLCSGDLIFMSDQDDVWFPNKVERVISHFLVDPQIMVVINDHILADQKLAHHNVTKLQKLRSKGLKDTAITAGCCTALRREWRDVALPIPTDDLPYDDWINNLADVLGVRMILPEPLQLYRLHASNASQCKLSITPSPKASPFDRVRACGLRDSRPYWLKEKADKEFFRQWIQKHPGSFRSPQLANAKQQTLSKLATEIRALERRIELMDLPRGLRAPAVAKFLMEGGYAHFSGWKSAVNDVLR